MDWLGKVVEKLGKPIVWAIGLAFLFMQIAGDKIDIHIKDDKILSIWNILGLVCLVFISIQVIIYIFRFFRTQSEFRNSMFKREIALIEGRNRRVDILNSLSDDQKDLLQRFCCRNKRIFHSHEIGGFRAVWQPDMEVLIYKGIVEQISYSTFEIKAQYYDIIKEAVNHKEELA